MTKGSIYTGTSNIVLPQPNRNAFPVELQQKSRLEIYSAFFNSVEVNSTFYRVPKLSTVQKWAELVPGDFKFTFKFWKEVTHNAGLNFDAADAERFINVISAAGHNLGCLLLQLPPKAGIAYLHQLEYLLTVIRQCAGTIRVAVEFRNKEWYNDDTYSLLDKFDATLVLHDMPSSAMMLPKTLSCLTYLRFHGPAGGYRGSYSDDFLFEYAQYIRDWSAGGKEVYVYFNNTMGDAVKNLQTLNKYLNAG